MSSGPLDDGSHDVADLAGGTSSGTAVEAMAVPEGYEAELTKGVDGASIG